MSKHWYLVTYDVREPRRLRRVAKSLEGYGTRIQYSVFRCRLRPRELERMHWELTKILDPTDELLIIGLCDGCSSRVRVKGQKDSWKEKEATFQIV
jgi:CRISPR-associated protein Cas2